MRADVATFVLAMTDPMATPGEVSAAMAWWDREVYAWRDARGELTDADRWAHYLNDRAGIVLEQRDGCGQVCVSYREPAPPELRELAV